MVYENRKPEVWAGFPGVGKSFFKRVSKSDDVRDSDSSLNKSNWPYDYIDDIYGSYMYDYDIKLILVSTHSEVLKGLIDKGVYIRVCYPDKSLKDVYIKRYKERGSPDAFVNLMESKFEEFIDDIESLNGNPNVKLWKFTEEHETISTKFIETRF